MAIPRALKSMSVVIMIASLVVMLYLGAALTVMTDTGFYLSEFEKQGVYDNFEDDREPIRLAYGLTTYFKEGSATQPNILGFNNQESLHLKDVKLIVLGLKKIFHLCAFLFIVSLVLGTFLLKGHLSRNQPRLFIAVGIATMGMGFIFILMAFFFSQSFTLFHQIFFPQGNWQFPLDSTLIRLFPEQFFLDAFLRIILRVSFFGLLLLSLGTILRRFRSQQKEL